MERKVKSRENKKNQKTKEVSLTINHNNLSQLVQMLNSQNFKKDGAVIEGMKPTHQSKACSCKVKDGDKVEEVCSYCSNQIFMAEDSNQQALSMIMQLISQNVHPEEGGLCERSPRRRRPL